MVFNTIYHAEMRNLEETDPDIWQAFMNGEFVVQKSPIPFTALFTDQALEQENKILKDHGGVGGVTQDEALLDRVCTVAPLISRMVKDLLSSFPKDSTSKDADL